MRPHAQLIQTLNQIPYGTALYRMDTDHPFFCSASLGLIFSCAPEELKNPQKSLLYDWIAPEDRKEVSAAVSTCRISGTVQETESRILCGDRENRWVRIRISRIEDDGELILMACFTDISSSRISMDQMEMMAERMNCAVTVFDLSSSPYRLTYLNQVFPKMTGISEEEYRKSPDEWGTKLMSAEDLKLVRSVIQKAEETDKPQETEITLHCPNGRTIRLWQRYCILPERAGQRWLVALGNDITEQYESRQQENYDNEKYRLLAEETDSAVFEWNLLDGKFSCSKNFYRYAMSSQNNNLILDNKGSLDTVYPEDLPLLFQFFKDTETKPKAEAVLRLKMTDGSYRWGRMAGIFIRDKNGNKIRVIGTVADIDEEKQKAIINERLMNAIPGGIAVMRLTKDNPVLECQYFSDGFARMSGRTRNDIDNAIREKKPFENIILPADRDRFLAIWSQKAEKKEPINIIYRYRTLAGVIKWAHVAATWIRDEQNCPVYYAVFTEPSEESLLYRTLTEESASATFVAEKQTRRILYVNSAWKMLERIPADIDPIGEQLYSLITEKQHLLTSEQLKVLPADTFYAFHTSRDDGRRLFVQARSILWNGIDAYVLYLYDETEQYHQQELLESNRALLNAAMQSANVSTWELDTVHKRIYQTELSQKTHGFGMIIENVPDTVLQNEHISMATQDRFRKMYDEIYAGRAAQAEVQIRLPADGKYHWERIMYKPVLDSEGKLIRAIGTSLNIDEQTDRRQQYEKQKKLSQALSSTAAATVYMDLTHNLVMDAQGSNPIILKALQADSAESVFQAVCRLIPEDRGGAEVRQLFNGKAMLELYYSGQTHCECTHGLSILPGWFESSCRMIYNPETKSVEALCVLKDISEEKQAERIINTLVDVIYDCIFTLDAGTGDIRIFPFEQQKEKPAPEKLESMIQTLCNGADGAEQAARDNSIPVIQNHLEKDKIYTASFFCREGEQTLRKRVSYSYLEKNQEVILGAIQDDTASWQEEEKRQKALQKALTEAKKASSAKSDFLSNMSHEIRTPMNVIIGMTKLAEDDVKKDGREVLTYLKQIDSSSEYLLGLLNDILDMSRIEKNKFELHQEWSDGKEAVHSCITMMKPLMEQKNISFAYPTMDDFPDNMELYVDGLRVRQVLMNLLNNAWKFTPEGGSISLTVKNLTHRDGFSEDEYVIQDNGCGMSQEYLKHAFEVFSQERNAFSAKVNGTGLGLPLTQKIVEAMGGTIHIESELGHGTEVTVVIPYRTRVKPDAAAAKIEVHADESILKGKRILICEDHPLNAMIAQKLLEEKDVQSDIAENGVKAIEMFESVSEYAYDAILMDIRMPEMDGLEATEKIRAMKRRDAKTIPIIAMTANAFEEDREASQKAGMNAHLAKPIQPETLYETLARLIAGNRR